MVVTDDFTAAGRLLRAGQVVSVHPAPYCLITTDAGEQVLVLESLLRPMVVQPQCQPVQTHPAQPVEQPQQPHPAQSTIAGLRPHPDFKTEPRRGGSNHWWDDQTMLAMRQIGELESNPDLQYCL